ncbi:MAG: NmrA family NAD(P)-binding protein, partial [Syntrophobacteraceae bacterium]|nr:NmrA family NAD(P)-binding protein [Syntrophobacteraceae bacterium]
MGPVAVLGATGYVGGRLVPELLRRGYRVRALVRSPEKLRCRPFSH